MKASFTSYSLIFNRPSGTSRGVLLEKPCWLIDLEDESGRKGRGEVSFIPGLSVEDGDEMDIYLDHLCKLITRGERKASEVLPAKPGVQFALECALQDMKAATPGQLFPSDFSKGLNGIPTNGLIWMGERDFMQQQVIEKMKAGFRVLKFKVGALDLKVELDLLTWVRKEYRHQDLEIRIDANGAWTAEEAPERLKEFSAFDIHSVEQPIKQGQSEAMARLCQESPIPIALDEELIGVMGHDHKRVLLEAIKPQYIILKPGLLGGLSEAAEWIALSEILGIGWWVTSALESSVGLNAIAQWAATLETRMHQGLGTGAIYSNNFESPLHMRGEELWYNSDE